MGAASFEASLERFASKLKDTLSAARIAEVRRVLAAECLSLIQRRTRAGKGISGDGHRLQQLKPLSKPYISFRKRNANRLSAFTSPRRSNLTFTGELLGSMALVERGGRTLIQFAGRRDSGLLNSKLAQYVQKDRPFFHLSNEEKETAQRRAIRTFEDLAKRGLVTLR